MLTWWLTITDVLSRWVGMHGDGHHAGDPEDDGRAAGAGEVVNRQTAIDSCSMCIDILLAAE